MALSRELLIGPPDTLDRLWRVGVGVSVIICGWLAFTLPWACAAASLVIACAALGRARAVRAAASVLRLSYLPTGRWRIDLKDGSRLEPQSIRTTLLPWAVFAELKDSASTQASIKLAVTSENAGVLAFRQLRLHLRHAGGTTTAAPG